jgi:hypothetical protein
MQNAGFIGGDHTALGRMLPLNSVICGSLVFVRTRRLTRLSKNLILDLRQVQVLHVLISRLQIHFAHFYTFSTVSTASVKGKGGIWWGKPKGRIRHWR